MQYGIAVDEFKYKNISLKLNFFSEFSPLLEGRFHTRILFQNKKKSLLYGKRLRYPILTFCYNIIIAGG